MEIRRFYVRPQDIIGDTVIISGDEFVHMTKVLRHKVGFKIIVNNNKDNIDYYAEIAEITDSAKAIVYDKRLNSGVTRKVTLLQALPKGDKADFITQKACELGVADIVFFKSEYSARGNINLPRLRKIAVEACKQCGRATVPDVSINEGGIESIMVDNDMTVFMNERENKIDYGSVNVDKYKVALIVGAEGGFSVSEAERFIAAGAVSVSLGKRILRAETASVAAITLTMFKLGELSLRN